VAKAVECDEMLRLFRVTFNLPMECRMCMSTLSHQPARYRGGSSANGSVHFESKAVRTHMQFEAAEGPATVRSCILCIIEAEMVPLMPLSDIVTRTDSSSEKSTEP